jgi:hypothetical protein
LNSCDRRSGIYPATADEADDGAETDRWIVAMPFDRFATMLAENRLAV